jgi:hypothetical protein
MTKHMVTYDFLWVIEFLVSASLPSFVKAYLSAVTVKFLHFTYPSLELGSLNLSDSFWIRVKRIQSCLIVSNTSRADWSLKTPEKLASPIVLGMCCIAPSIMVTGKSNWSFRDSKARNWLRKGKVLAPLVRPT